MSRRPRIGITPDVDQQDARTFLRPWYARMVVEAGGVPVILAPSIATVGAYIELCDGVILSGGDDPIMERWGIKTHAKATRVHSDRQAFECAMLDELRHAPELPVLGICLGMQLMALHAGGAIEQHLPETNPDLANRHWGRVPHPARINMDGSTIEGVVLSHHRQAIVDPGGLVVCGASDDGVIEAVCDHDRPFYLGVQWHPERTDDAELGLGIMRRLVHAAGDAHAGRATSGAP